MTRPHMTTLPETPMSAWLREHHALESRTNALSITDIDYLFEKYMVHLDSLGTRMLKAALLLEVKCYNTVPTTAQAENLFLHHLLLSTRRRFKTLMLAGGRRCHIRHFGVAVLSLPGVAPEDHGDCRWGVFSETGVLQWTTIPCRWLTDILNFAICPDSLKPWDLRRHHKNTMVVAQEQMPLGFMVDRVFLKRS